MCRDCTDGARKAIVSMVYNVVIRSPTVSSCRTYLRSNTELFLSCFLVFVTVHLKDLKYMLFVCNQWRSDRGRSADGAVPPSGTCQRGTLRCQKIGFIIQCTKNGTKKVQKNNKIFPLVFVSYSYSYS